MTSSGDIFGALARLRGLIHHTPVVSCHSVTQRVAEAAGVNADDLDIRFKCENFQRTGSFKIRGALNAAHLAKQSGVGSIVTHSSGNHAQAIALAGKTLEMDTIVVMPRDSSESKIRAVKGYGCRHVVFCEPEKREDEARNAMTSCTNSVLIPSYNHPDVIAGQGTVALEILEDFPECEALLIAVGGGGLISGCAVAAKAAKPTMLVYGAEPQAADDAYRSKMEGRLVTNQRHPTTVADGLRTNLGSLTWPVVRDEVDEIFLVSEGEIARALEFVVERMKMLIEPSAAVPVAALLNAAALLVRQRGLRKICVILCGGNVDVRTVAAIVQAGGYGNEASPQSSSSSKKEGS